MAGPCHAPRDGPGIFAFLEGRPSSPRSATSIGPASEASSMAMSPTPSLGVAPSGESMAGTARRSEPLTRQMAPHTPLPGRLGMRRAPEPARGRGRPRLGAGRGVGFSARCPDQGAASFASAA